jgi:hypothetical protein
MRTIFLATFLATVCMAFLAAAPAIAQDCAAIQAACVDQCVNTAGATGQLNPVTGNQSARVQACINRCSIAPCQQTPLSNRLCDANAQNLCNKGFRACTDSCTPSTATTQAIIETQASCTTFCCTQLKACLTHRFCDISSITTITCQ